MKNLFAYMQQVYDRRSFALILSSVFLLNVVSCSRKTNPSSDYNSMLSDTVFTLKIDRPYYIDKFSNLFSEVRYVVLEETQNSIVGEITKMEITKNGDFIVFDMQSGSVFRFAYDGKFLNNIGFRGAGENEYVLPWDIAYDPYSDKVLVWDNGKSAILAYGMDGKIESKIQLPWIIDKLGVIDQENLICYMNHGESVSEGDKGTNYKLIKRDGTVVKEFGVYGSEMNDFRPASMGFCTQLEKCLHLPPFSSTLYAVEGDSLNAVATFDLQENAIPKEWIRGSHRDLRTKLKDHPNLIEISSVYETSQYYLLNMTRNHVHWLGIVDKSDHSLKSVCTHVINDMFGMVGNTNLIYAYDDKVCFEIEPSSFENERLFLNSIPAGCSIKDAILKEKDAIYENTASMFGADAAVAHVDSLKSANFKLSPGERELISEMSQKSNPIIQVCKLK